MTLMLNRRLHVDAYHLRVDDLYSIVYIDEVKLKTLPTHVLLDLFRWLSKKINIFWRILIPENCSEVASTGRWFWMITSTCRWSVDLTLNIASYKMVDRRGICYQRLHQNTLVPLHQPSTQDVQRRAEEVGRHTCRCFKQHTSTHAPTSVSQC